MRYFIVTYVRRAVRGKSELQTDEVISISKALRPRDIQTASVILDFSRRRIEKANFNDITIDRNWDKIRDFYFKHYESTIKQLEELNPQKD